MTIYINARIPAPAGDRPPTTLATSGETIREAVANFQVLYNNTFRGSATARVDFEETGLPGVMEFLLKELGVDVWDVEVTDDPEQDAMFRD